MANTYQIQDPQGRTLEIQGDHEPTAAELTNIFSEAFPPTPSQSPAIPLPGAGGLDSQPPVQQPIVYSDPQSRALAQASQQKVAPLTGAEVEEMAMTPNVTLPNPIPPSWPITRGAVGAAKAIPEFFTAPAAPYIMMAQGIPVVREMLDAAMGAGMVKQSAQQAGQAYATGNKEQMTQAILSGLMGTTMTLGAAPQVREGVANEIAARRVGAPDKTAADYAAQYLSMPRNRGVPIQLMPEVAAQMQGGLFNPRALQGAQVTGGVGVRRPGPVVPATPPEPERGMTVLEEIRAAEARTKQQIQDLFPKAKLSREEAQKLRNMAWAGQPLSDADIERVFGLKRLDEIANSQIQAGGGGGAPPNVREMGPRGPFGEEGQGAPSVEDVRAQRAQDEAKLAQLRLANEFTLLRRENPNWSDIDIWNKITEAVRNGQISLPKMSEDVLGGNWAPIMNFNRYESRPANRPGGRYAFEYMRELGGAPPPATERRLLPPPSTESMTPRGPMGEGGESGLPPSLEEIRAQRDFEQRRMRQSAEWKLLKKKYPSFPDEQIDQELLGLIEARLGKLNVGEISAGGGLLRFNRGSTRTQQRAEYRRRLPPNIREMTPRPGTEGGAPSVEDVRAQREFEERRQRLAAEYQELKRRYPNATDEYIMAQILQDAPHLMPAMPMHGIPGMRGIMSINRPHTHEVNRPLRHGGWEPWERPNLQGMPDIGPEGQGPYEPYDPRNKPLTPEEENARRQQEAAALYGNVRPLEQGGVPTQESGRGVQPQTQGRISEEKASEAVRVEHPNYGTAVVDDQGNVHWGTGEHGGYGKGTRGYVISADPNYEFKPLEKTMRLDKLQAQGFAFITDKELEQIGGFSEAIRRLRAGEPLLRPETPAAQQLPGPIVGEESGWRIMHEKGWGYWLIDDRGQRVFMSDSLEGAKKTAQEFPYAELDQAFALPPEVAELRGENKPPVGAPQGVTQTGSPSEAQASAAKTPAKSAGEPLAISQPTPSDAERQVGEHPKAKTEPKVGGTANAEPGSNVEGVDYRGMGVPPELVHIIERDVVANLRKIEPTIRFLREGRHIKEGMRYLRDWAENGARIFARNVANDIRQPLRRMFRGRQFKLADEALTFVVEAQQDPNRLRDMRVRLASTPQANWYWKARAERALAFANAHWDQLVPLAERYKQATDTLVYLENNSGIPTLRRDGYVPHRQEIEDLTFLSEGGQGQSSFFEKVRTHDTYVDSIVAGLDPKSLSSTALLENRTSMGMQLVNNREWLRVLRGWRDQGSGDPVVQNPRIQVRADGSTQRVPPTPNYVLQNFGQETVAVRKGYEALFSALTRPSWLRENFPTRAFLTANATGKSVNLMIDTFHLGRVAFWDSIIKPLGISTFQAPFPSYKRGVTMLDFTPNQIREMAAAREIPQEWLNTMLEDKRRLDLGVRSGFNVGRIGDSLYQDLIQKVPGIGTLNKWIFDQFQRGAMAESYLLEYERLRRARPNLSDVEVARATAKAVNTRFGALGRQGIFKSRTAQDIARVFFLAPQWNEGLIRTELGAVKELGTLLRDTARGDRLFAGLMLRSVGAMAVMQFVANQIINQITRGKFTWENPEEGWGAKLSAWVPDLVEGGPGFFLHPLGLAAETTHLLTNMYSRRGGSTAQVALDYARSRSSVAMRPLITLLTGTDFLSRKISPENLWGAIVRSAIATPIAGQAAFNFAKQAVTGEPSQTFAGQYQKQAMSSLGIRSERAPSPEQRILALAQEWRREHGVPNQVQVVGLGDYQGLVQALRLGNEAQAREIMVRLRKDKTDEQIRQHFQRWANAPFTGSMARERQFLRGLSAEQQMAYLKARNDRQKMVALVNHLLR